MMDTAILPGGSHEVSVAPAELTQLIKSLDARGRYKCAVCGKLFNQNQSAIFLHHMRSFRCKTCKNELRCFSRLIVHKRSPNCQYRKECKDSQRLSSKKRECESDSVMLQCEHCGKFVNTERDLKNHIAFRHGDKGAPEMAVNDKAIQWKRCKLCDKTFYSKRFHLTLSRDRKCRVCKLLFKCRGLRIAHEKTCQINRDTQIEVQPPPAPAEKKMMEELPQPGNSKTDPASTQFKCVHCSDLCPSEEVLRNHSRPTNCPRCGFLQACSKMLAHHLDCCRFEAAPQPSQPVLPRYRCPLCGESCGDATLLGSHILCCSPKEEHFNCKLCGEIFYKASELESHEQRYHPDHMAQAELIRVLSMENKHMKQALTTTFVQNNFVKKEPVELITLDESDDEKGLDVKVKSDIKF